MENKNRLSIKRVIRMLAVAVVMLVCCTVTIRIVTVLRSENASGSGLPCLHSRYAVLMDMDKGEIIGECRGTQRMYPASLTKIMTAIVAIENTEDLNSTLTLPETLFSMLYLENASLAGFEPGEIVTLRDLLYGMLLPSGAECCIAYAKYIAGSEEKYVDMMNEKAWELGMVNTNFTNTTGLHDEKHYSTARDMALLLRYALENEEFRSIFTSHRYTVSSTNIHSEGFTMYSTMFKNLDSTELLQGEILGGKTGYTQKAGLCLASLANVNGREYILVTAKADGNHKTVQYNIEDALKVYDNIAESYTNN